MLLKCFRKVLVKSFSNYAFPKIYHLGISALDTGHGNALIKRLVCCAYTERKAIRSIHILFETHLRPSLLERACGFKLSKFLFHQFYYYIWLQYCHILPLCFFIYIWKQKKRIRRAEKVSYQDMSLGSSEKLAGSQQPHRQIIFSRKSCTER